MGGGPSAEEPAAPAGDAAARALPLPHRDDAPRWRSFLSAFADPPVDAAALGAAMAAYRPPSDAQDARMAGVRAMLGEYPGAGEALFSRALPAMVLLARELPELSAAHPGALRTLHQGVAAARLVPRRLAASLLANMFLCTFEGLEQAQCKAYNTWTFDMLLRDGAPQEVAKLRMFVNYFDRIHQGEPLDGEVRIYRRHSRMTPDAWASCAAPLSAVESAPPRVGFEASIGKGYLEADFANAWIGGGVISGGCVQEEIRFAISPENCVACLLCPCMLADESIQIIGAQQFSAYEGYMFGLRYAGDHRSEHGRDADGTPLVAIAAIDALDGRGGQHSLAAQLSVDNMLRELNKAHAGFDPADERFGVVATGNWGCGVFGGHHQLKAVLQWIAASARQRRVIYFPYDKALLGDALADLSRRLRGQGATAGELWAALCRVAAHVRDGARCSAAEGDGVQPTLFDLLAAKHAELHGCARASCAGGGDARGEGDEVGTS